MSGQVASMSAAISWLVFRVASTGTSHDHHARAHHGDTRRTGTTWYGPRRQRRRRHLTTSLVRLRGVGTGTVTTYLATRRDLPGGWETLAYCSVDCIPLVILSTATVRRDDSYEFEEKCASCGVLIPAFIPPEDELRDQIRYSLRAIRNERIENRLTTSEAMHLLNLIVY
jgi:hypothetical protein